MRGYTRPYEGRDLTPEEQDVAEALRAYTREGATFYRAYRQ